VVAGLLIGVAAYAIAKDITLTTYYSFSARWSSLVGRIVLDDAGSVDGTPAPYLQLLVCKKD